MDAIFHIAGAIKAASRQDFFEANQLGTRRLLQAVADVNPDLKRFVHMSSLAAAGPSKDGRKLREDESPHPISWYGESKLESEREVLEFAKTYPVTILRPSAVYGPRDMETLLIFRMIQRGCLFTPGTSSRKFSLIHVADLCEACIQAAENNTQSGEIFFISRPEVYRWEDVGDEISRSLKKSYIRVPFPKWIAKVAGAIGSQWSNWTGRAVTVNRQKILELLEPFWVCDPSKAMKIIGFSASIPLDRGIKDTVAWYQKIGFL
jgi:nucleoside-diphosphate-sugar epimerase